MWLGQGKVAPQDGRAFPIHLCLRESQSSIKYIEYIKDTDKVLSAPKDASVENEPSGMVEAEVESLQDESDDEAVICV